MQKIRWASLQKKIPLVQALAWIVLSTFLVSGGLFSLVRHYYRQEIFYHASPSFDLQVIVQTSVEKEALKSLYLCELMELSLDRPVNIFSCDPKTFQEKLLKSPLIKSASVKLIKPHTIFVDYTARKPIAWLFDFQNTFVDEEGYLFPVSPFFSPKKIPEIYLGLPSFPGWSAKISGEHFNLALKILQTVSHPPFDNLFFVKRIDVSLASAPSYGKREIVLEVEESSLVKEGEGEVLVASPRLLRLSTKNYLQEIANYLELREGLAKGNPGVAKKEGEGRAYPVKVIDFRIPQLAFIEEKKE